MIYLEGQVNCKRISEYWQEEVAPQGLVEFLNSGKFDLTRVNKGRFNRLLSLALNHPNMGDGEGIYKTRRRVMSCFIYGSRCIPFKKILYF